jgi:hypothetical protein
MNGVAHSGTVAMACQPIAGLSQCHDPGSQDLARQDLARRQRPEGDTAVAHTLTSFIIMIIIKAG